MVKAWLPVAGYAVLILALSSIPDPGNPGGVKHADKLAHLVEYGGLGWLTARAVVRSGRRKVGACLALAVLAGAAFAALDELYQGTRGRTTSAGDWAADVTGLLLATAAVWWLHTRRGS